MPLAKTAMQGGVLYDWLNTDFADFADAMRVGEMTKTG